MRFAAEMTLGRLARKLRLLGFDTDYDPRRDARRLLALDDGECYLLGRTAWLRREPCGGRMIWIGRDRPEDQLRTVIRAAGISASNLAPFTRCVCCNCPVVPADRFAVRERVPDYVWATQTRFNACPVCGRIYWPGTHSRRIQAWMGALFPEEPDGEATP
jgi:uncharacterized protein with PIN domain